MRRFLGGKGSKEWSGSGIRGALVNKVLDNFQVVCSSFFMEDHPEPTSPKSPASASPSPPP